MRTSLAFAVASFAPAVLGHFVLNYPHSLGFSDDNEGTSPCGGETVSFNGTLDSVQTGGFAVALTTTHPQAEFLYRVTLSKEEPFNWTNILPVVSQTGVGAFCLPSLSIPSSFVGQQGLIQIIQDAADGMLYQCAAVNFVEGTNSTVGSGCTNATAVTASVTDQNSFSSSASGSATASSSTATATSSSSAMLNAVPAGFLGSVAAMLMLV